MLQSWTDGTKLTEVIFWFLFVISGYWYLFYKMQTSINLVMPQNSTYYSGFIVFIFKKVLFCVMFVFKTVIVLEELRIKNNLNIYLLDWEDYRIRKEDDEQI